MKRYDGESVGLYSCLQRIVMPNYRSHRSTRRMRHGQIPQRYFAKEQILRFYDTQTGVWCLDFGQIR